MSSLNSMKWNKLFLLAAGFFTAFSLNAWAQTNSTATTNGATVVVPNSKGGSKIEAPTKNGLAATIKYPWNSMATAGLTLTRGNSDTLLATAKIASGKKTPVNEFSLGADIAYGSASGIENNNTYHAFGQWNHLFSEKWYDYVRDEGLHDGIAQVKYRFTVTAGMGYYFIKQTNTTLTTEVGPGVVVERTGAIDNTYATLRLGEHFEHKFNKNSARIWQTVEVLPQVDKPSDYLVNFEIGIESALYRSVNLQVYLDDNYNSQPAVDFRRNDTKLVSGISYKF